MSASPPPTINSLGWWDDYFVQKWESYDGRGQTRYFMRRLLDSLPAREAKWLASGPHSILDWGCALGDGVDLLKTQFPDCAVSGLDFSATAITKARSNFPQHSFILAAQSDPPPRADVIITSNCLEHFTAPFEVAARHVSSCNSVYVAMTPFREEHLHESHVIRFELETYPARIGEFARIASTVIRCEPPYWNGEQIIVTYGSPEYIAARS